MALHSLKFAVVLVRAGCAVVAVFPPALLLPSFAGGSKEARCMFRNLCADRLGDERCTAERERVGGITLRGRFGNRISRRQEALLRAGMRSPGRSPWGEVRLSEERPPRRPYEAVDGLSRPGSARGRPFATPWHSWPTGGGEVLAHGRSPSKVGRTTD